MIRSDIKEFLNTIPNNVTLVAATKYGDANDLRELYNAGVSSFGENRVDVFLTKYEALKDLDIKWNFIGHLQRNKAKEVINKINYLHSLDSLELARDISKYRSTPLDCFIEVSINLEENKNGVPYYKAESFIEQCLEYPNVHVVGLMMMAVANSSSFSLHEQFRKLRTLKEEIEHHLNIELPYLSMGMSDDYEIAIMEGATHIRLGRILFDNKGNENMSTKEEWKQTGKNTGKAFSNFGKALGKTMKVVFTDEENKVEENGRTEVSNAWREMGKSFAEAGKSFGKAMEETVETAADDKNK